jgi:transcriptional regulator with XRE-family HTH domain
MDLAELIQQHRGRLRLSQAELAQRVGVRQATVSEWESGKSAPGAVKLATLADVFGVPLSELRAAKSGDLIFARQTDTGVSRIPEWLENRAVALDRELAKAGVVDSQLNYIQEILRSPATLKFVLRNDDGSPRPAAEQQQQLELFIDGMRFWLARSATPGGALIAPVTAAPEPGTHANVAQPRGKKK